MEVNSLATEALKKNVETLTMNESSGGIKARTVMVSGLSEDATENGLHIHFQKKKNGGGDIEEITLLPRGKALVVFEDPEGL